MIRFAMPLLLSAALPVLGVLFWVSRREARRPLLRAASLLLVVLALAQPRLDLEDRTNNIMFLVDRSVSVTRGVDDRDVSLTLDALASRELRWNYGVISFAASAELDTPLGSPPMLAPPPLRDASSDLSEAVDLALDALPPGRPNQIVLLSDGRFTSDTAGAVAQAQLANVPISVIPLGSPQKGDVRIASLVAPSEATAGRAIALDVGIDSVESGNASIAVYRNGDLVEVLALELTAGTSQHRFTDLPPDAGLFEYKAVVKKPGDPVPENDARSVCVRTVNHPSILVVDPDGGSAVPSLLRSLGLTFVTTATVPELTGLAEYRQVLLVGTPLADLTERESRDLEQFVRQLGGGLLAVLGERDVRGFASGDMEEILPVSFTVPEMGQQPSLAVVYLLDRSNSMNELAGAKAKIRVLREATAASVLLLPSETLVGIVEFYDAYRWTFPLQRLGDGTEAYRAIASIAAFGGTDIYYPLNDAVDRLIQADARVKQILLISDGQTTEAGRDYPGLFAKLDEHTEITVSAIGVSADPNIPFLTRVVEHGRGELYIASTFATLPQLTMDITQRLSRSRFVTGDITVTPSAGPLADLGELPPLQGYVLTYPRAEAATLLWAGDDPVFSTWRIGLGSVSVLNADLSGVWSSQWLSWERMAELFDRLLQTTEPLATVATGVTTTLDVGSDETTLGIDVRTPRGAFDNFLSFVGTLLPEASPLRAEQAAPGLYEAVFPTPTEGAHAVLAQEQRTGRSFSLPVSIPYAHEYDAFGVESAALEQLAVATGGRVLTDDLRLLPAHASTPRREAHLFPYLLGIALALFLLDLALRVAKGRSRVESD